MAVEFQECLKSLRLPGVKDCYQEVADRARAQRYTYEQYLAEVLDREREERRRHRIERYLRASRLPLEKNLDSFDRSRVPAKVDAQLSLLLEGSFVDRTENILAFGNPGSGKSHLLCALAQELVYQGRRVLFRSCDLLVQELLIAKRDLRLSHVLKKLSRFQALLIDDIGYVQQSREEMEVLFTLLSHRYERGSVMVTANLPFSEWEKIFKDPMTTAAAIDRLVHHSVILELNIPSYRLEHAQSHQRSTDSPGEAK
ncbi:IS21 family transposase ISGur8 [subsurface metagenome]|jgi:DNA replication protein DnaC